jgi:galactose-1-phosphate uridylyltransferase
MVSSRTRVLGYELLAEAQRNITPERSAEMLREKVAETGAVSP